MLICSRGLTDLGWLWAPLARTDSVLILSRGRTYLGRLWALMRRTVFLSFLHWTSSSSKAARERYCCDAIGCLIPDSGAAISVSILVFGPCATIAVTDSGARELHCVCDPEIILVLWSCQRTMADGLVETRDRFRTKIGIRKQSTSEDMLGQGRICTGMSFARGDTFYCKGFF